MQDFYTNLMQEWTAIKSRISFGRILAHYRVLVKEKSNMALCPFHDDHNPSMHVSELQGLYHCFSCGASGDIISFIMNKEQCNFIEAVHIACHVCGVPCTALTQKISDPEESKLFEFNHKAAEYFHIRLLENSKITLMLARRGITTDHIMRHKLGYAPDIRDLALYPPPNPSEWRTNKLIDKQNRLSFSQRIIFPIMLTSGEIVGFGARALYHNQNMKYLNSPESSIFVKRNLAYNMQFLTKSNDKPLYIVEGYFDAIKLQEIGYRAVALMGTSLSKKLFETLCEYSNDLVLALDQDSAGIKATENIIENVIFPSLKSHTNIFVAIYRYKDPAEAVNANKFIHLPIPLATYCQFYLDQKYPNSNNYQKFYQLAHKINDREARTIFHEQLEHNNTQKQKDYNLIRSFQTDIYIKTYALEEKYLRYLMCFKLFPDIGQKLKEQYPHPLIVQQIDDFHSKAMKIKITHAEMLEKINKELLDFQYCCDFLMDEAIENCLKNLKEKSKNILLAEEALEIFKITMEIINIRK